MSGAYQNKRLEDRYGATGTVNEKSSNSWPVAMQFDHRDRFGGGGITYGMATWTSGNLNLNGAFAATDAATAQTAGHFNKYNLDIARIQKLPGDFALYGRYSAQWTSQNLDSSERFGLGGIYGVRAYPLGEGMGDRGWLGQIELRYLAGPYTPFVFYDAGRSDTNARPWDTASSTSRSIAGGAGDAHEAFGQAGLFHQGDGDGAGERIVLTGGIVANVAHQFIDQHGTVCAQPGEVEPAEFHSERVGGEDTVTADDDSLGVHLAFQCCRNFDRLHAAAECFGERSTNEAL